MSGRILVLDDEENYAKMLHGLLCDHNYRVDMATQPELAIKQLEKFPYDLVISDYKMPVMDGSDFLKRAREIYPNLPFILVSGLMNTPELVKVANMSVTLVLEKPLDTELFLKHVERFSSPMTDEEKKAPVEVLSVAEPTKGKAFLLPKAPSFFSAKSPRGRTFLEECWSKLSAGFFIFISTPEGSDFDYAVKDFSRWLGNGDKLITEYSLSALLESGLFSGNSTEDYSHISSLLVVRLSDAAEAEKAYEFTKSIPTAERFKVIFQISDSNVAEMKSLKEMTVPLPALNLRKSDMANYARRIVRIEAERLGRLECAKFTDDAAYSMMEYTWPENYSELKTVITSAVENADDAPLDSNSLGSAFGNGGAGEVSSHERLKGLLGQSQIEILKMIADESEGGFEALKREFSLSEGIEEFVDVALLKPDLANI